MGEYIKMIKLNVQLLFFICLLFLEKTILKLSKNVLDFLFCLFIVVLYLVHVKYILMPFMLNNIKDQQGCWLAFYLGISIELLKIFLYISKIKWMVFYLANVILNFGLLHYLFKSPNFQDYIWMRMFPVIVGSFVLPFLIVFLKERNEKNQFCCQKNYENYFKSYENLIKNLIPDPILILNSKKSEILFCNTATKELFESKQKVYILSQLSQIELTQTQIIASKNLDNSCVLQIYHDLIDKDLKFECMQYEGVYTKQMFQTSPKFRKFIDSKDSKKLYFDIKFVSIYWREEKAFLVLLNDTSPIFNYKKMKEITHYKDQVLATFSHDLRSPLSGIVGMLEIAKESERIDQEMKEVLKNAMNSAKILKFLVNDIVDFSFLLKKQLNLIRDHFRIGEVIREVVEIVENQIKEKGLIFYKEYTEEILNSFVFIDITRLKQILLNLIINSIKFTSKGFIKIHIKINLQEKIADFIIEDTGIGIPEENIQNLFSLFDKFDNEEFNPQRAGLGFGLVISQALAKKICPFSKGLIVNSSIGLGSQFGFSIPLSDSISELRDSQIPITSERLDIKKYSLNANEHTFAKSLPKNIREINRTIRVLVVDDDMINIMVHSQYMKKFNFCFDVAYNGKEALEKILELSLIRSYYSVILMDCNMPILDGFKASEMIQEMIKENKIPYLDIIAVTANASIRDMEKCNRSGMNYFLEKPVSIEMLREKLEKILRISIYYN